MEISFKKYLLSAAIGFGIGGALWGLVLYGWIPDIDYPLNIVGILTVLFGGISLSIFSKNIKRVFKVSGFGLLGGVLGLVVAFLGIYHLFLLGTWLLSVFLPSYEMIKFLELEPSLKISGYWLNFILAGIFIGLFFAIAFKTKIWPVVWRGGAGFGVGSLVGPIIGNLIGNLFGLLLINYLITFGIIGGVLGLFLGWGIYINIKNQK